MTSNKQPYNENADSGIYERRAIFSHRGPSIYSGNPGEMVMAIQKSKDIREMLDGKRNITNKIF